MAKRNDRELKSIGTPAPSSSGPRLSQNAPEHVRRASAMQRILDMKKSYDFWQDLVSRNVRQRLRPSNFVGHSVASVPEETRSNIDERRRSEPASDGISTGDFFSDQDLQFLRSRLDEIVSQNGIQLKDGEVERLLESCVSEAKNSGGSSANTNANDNANINANSNTGFDPYGDDDEEGLHDENCGFDDDEEEYELQDDYDMGELNGSEPFSYGAPSASHRFEVELSDGPRNAAANSDEGDGDGDGDPSCEFTFEYDRDGNLIPTSSNIEEKLRLMKLQSQISSEALSSAQAQAMALAQAQAQAQVHGQGGKKKKKSSKKKKKGAIDEHGSGGSGNGGTTEKCMFCQYEEFYGTQPVYFMKRQDFTHKWEMERRRKFREKLETAKSDARARHERSRGEHHYDYESDGSNGTVEDG